MLRSICIPFRGICAVGRLISVARLALVLDAGIELAEEADAAFGAEAHDVADAELARALDQRLPARAVDTLDQRRVDLRLGR